MRPAAVIGLCILYLHVARRRRMCLQLIASLPDRRDIRCLLHIALPAIARCATQSKLVFFCCLVGTCVSVGSVFMSGASRDDLLCAAQTSTNGHGLRSMDTSEEDPIQLENFHVHRSPEPSDLFGVAALITLCLLHLHPWPSATMLISIPKSCSPIWPT